jgi:hypothetical protein
LIYTSSLPPGNLTVANCSSLYFSKAGVNDWRVDGSSARMDLIAVCHGSLESVLEAERINMHTLGDI